MSTARIPNVFYLTGSPAALPARMEGIAALARGLRETSPSLSETALRALIHAEHVLETEANSPALNAALLAEAEAEGALA